MPVLKYEGEVEIAGETTTITLQKEIDNLDVDVSSWVKSALELLLDQAHSNIVTMRRPLLEEPIQDTGPLAVQAAGWRVPEELHMRSAKAAHRALVALAELQQRGKAVRPKDWADRAHLSLPPVYRMLDRDTDVGNYLEPLLQVTADGKGRYVDLTDLGQRVASLVRAGQLPQ